MTHPNETNADTTRIIKNPGLEAIGEGSFFRTWLERPGNALMAEGDQVLAIISKAGIVRHVEVLQKPAKLGAKIKKKPAIYRTISCRSESDVRFRVKNSMDHMDKGTKQD